MKTTNQIVAIALTALLCASISGCFDSDKKAEAQKTEDAKALSGEVKKSANKGY